MGNSEEQLPYELDFCHKFNLHKWLGLIMDDYDLKTIARIYGVKLKKLKKIEAVFARHIDELVESCHSNGLLLGVYVVNDEKTFQFLKEKNVDLIFSDCSDIIGLL